MNSLRSIRGVAAGAIGAGAVAGAMLFGGIPAAQAAPAPAPATSFETVGPHGGAPLSPGVLPERPGGHGWGHGGWGHGGFGHGWGHSGWGHGGFGRGWGHGGWGHGWGHFWRPWF
ncbi:hypothetical protein OK015_04245 [Mycobacterium sp. Aquia_216]|uniref:hypothetical protein n=1 Tax=Mycobacterium sp. Aquia_216 TaxID=2991729 RepID=UPI00227C0586|nr:hypothetical protein [Mycobacterium sp. Aquia_216]WAJ45725.1 hypothetical protein OK015_04245 [Mycobacterium sp. Aquia_216]